MTAGRNPNRECDAQDQRLGGYDAKKMTEVSLFLDFNIPS